MEPIGSAAGTLDFFCTLKTEQRKRMRSKATEGAALEGAANKVAKNKCGTLIEIRVKQFRENF